MDDSLDEYACTNCGGLTEYRREGSTQGMYCTDCGWNAVTTYMPPIMSDHVKYQVTVISGDFKNENHLKAVADLLEVNWLAARKMLLAPETFVAFTGRAYKVKPVQSLLTAAGLEFKIEPPFPW